MHSDHPATGTPPLKQQPKDLEPSIFTPALSERASVNENLRKKIPIHKRIIIKFTLLGWWGAWGGK